MRLGELFTDANCLSFIGTNTITTDFYKEINAFVHMSDVRIKKPEQFSELSCLLEFQWDVLERATNSLIISARC
jgi:hypothetical protein